MASPLAAPIRDAFALPAPTALSFSDTNAATFSVAGLLELTGSTQDVLRALANSLEDLLLTRYMYCFLSSFDMISSI